MGTGAEAKDRDAVREGEGFDIAAVDAWLRGILPELDGTAEVTQFRGGASNWTYRLKYPHHDLILRRPPAGTKAKGAHDMEREYRIQAALKAHFPEVPTMVGLCRDEGVINSEFYVMQRIGGFIPRSKMPEDVTLGTADVRRMCDAAIERWVDLHRVDYQVAGLDWLYKGPGYVRRQVEGWSQRYEKARTWNVPSWDRVRRWLAERAPEDGRPAVIHNDWRFDNLVFSREEPARIVGVLDWELATVGDARMDVGSALAYWVHADDPWMMRVTRRQPTHLPGMMRREEVVERWADRMGVRLDDWPFFEVFGLFRLAVIAQQIYYRYHHKQTRNPAFRNFWIFINYFEWRCRGIIRRAERSGRLSKASGVS